MKIRKIKIVYGYGSGWHCSKCGCYNSDLDGYCRRCGNDE